MDQSVAYLVPNNNNTTIIGLIVARSQLVPILIQVV